MLNKVDLDIVETKNKIHKMKTRYYLFILITMAGLASCNPLTEEQEKSDALYHSIKKEYTLHEDGSIDYRYSHDLEIRTHMAFNRMYGETFVVFNPEFQDLEVHKSVTTMRDGKEVPSPENAYNEVLPRWAAGAPDFNHLREMVITHTGLETGSTIHLDYTLHSKAGYLPFLSAKEILPQSSPVKEMEVIVKVPENQEIDYLLLNLPGQPNQTADEGYKVYKWEFNDLEAIAHEPALPHTNAHLPQLLFSSVNLNKAIATLSKPLAEELPAEIVDKTRDRIEGMKYVDEKVFELQNLVANEMNNINIPIEHTAYAPRGLEEIWRSNNGTELEKTLLLQKVFEVNGISSTPIATISVDGFKDNMGIPENNGHYYLRINSEKPYFISASKMNKTNLMRYYAGDYQVVLTAEEEIVEAEKIIGDKSATIGVTGKLNLHKDGTIEGNTTTKFQGLAYDDLSLMRDEENTTQLLQSIYSGATIENINIRNSDANSIELDAKVEFKKAVKEQGDFMITAIPESKEGLQRWHLNILPDERQYDIYLPSKLFEKYEYELQIPEGMKWVGKAASIDTSFNGAELHFAIKQEGNLIFLEKEINLTETSIPKEHYQAFKSMINLWNEKNYNEIVIKK